MVKMIVFILAACIGLTLAITRCAPQKQGGTLTITPAADFPDDKKADLGRGIARILPQCPGLGRVGEHLVFNAMSMNAEGTTITFSVPEKSMLPAEWGRFDQPCVYLITQNNLIMEGPSCQAVCLGRVPEKAEQRMIIELPLVKRQ